MVSIRNILLDPLFMGQYYSFTDGLQRKIDYIFEDIIYTSNVDGLFPPSWLDIKEPEKDIFLIPALYSRYKIIVVCCHLPPESLYICSCKSKPSQRELEGMIELAQRIKNSN